MGHKDDIENLNDVNDPIQLGHIFAIRLHLAEGNVVLHIIRLMLWILQLKLLLRDMAQDDPTSILRI